jgi:hypothetical protein
LCDSSLEKIWRKERKEYMRLKNGNRFRIQCDDPETITFVMTDGTVDEVTTDLDGVEKILAQGEELTFEVSKDNPRRLTVTYVFKANKGEEYETEVSGSGGGDVSLDKHKQLENEASKSRRYSFDA